MGACHECDVFQKYIIPSPKMCTEQMQKLWITMHEEAVNKEAAAGDVVDLPTLLVAGEATSSPSLSMGIVLRRVRSSVFMAQRSSIIWTAACALN